MHLGHHPHAAVVVMVAGTIMPSITHISHNGRRRSTGSYAIWPQISESLARSPGGDNLMQCRWRSTWKFGSSTKTGRSRFS